jgi:preprotein translocase subunit YajC
MKVVTTSGIHGKIINLIDQTVVVESENSRLRFERSAISKEMSQKAYPENKS